MVPPLHTMSLTDRHPLLAPLLPTEPEGDLRALLLGLRSAAVAPPASNDELLARVEAACKVFHTGLGPPASRTSSQQSLQPDRPATHT